MDNQHRSLRGGGGGREEEWDRLKGELVAKGGRAPKKG